jgi:hypothetical protein
MYEYGMLKPVEVILRNQKWKKENNGGDESNWGILYEYVEKLQQNPLYHYYVLIKTLK